MKVKKISGYRGLATHVAAGGIEFFIIAGNARDLEAVYNSVLADAEPFTREACHSVILISASDLKLTSAQFVPDEITLDEKPQS